MGLDEVILAVHAEAQAEAERTVREARAETDAVVREAQETATKSLGEARTHAEAEVQALKNRMVASARLEAKKRQLEAQAAAFQNLRQAVLERAAALTGKEREDALKALLTQAEARHKRVRAPGKDAALFKTLGYEVTGNADTAFGCIVEGDGYLEDLTLERLLDQRWTTLAAEAATGLFKERKE